MLNQNHEIFFSQKRTFLRSKFPNITLKQMMMNRLKISHSYFSPFKDFFSIFSENCFLVIVNFSKEISLQIIKLQAFFCHFCIINSYKIRQRLVDFLYFHQSHDIFQFILIASSSITLIRFIN